MTARKKHSNVLQDHIKKGSTFYPPFSFMLGDIRLQEINWRADFVPELIWIALLVQEHGFDKANKLVCILSVIAMKTHTYSTIPDFGMASTYSLLSSDTKVKILKQLEDLNILNEFRAPLLPLIILYPECPLSFLIKPPIKTPNKKDATTKVGHILEECLYRGEKLPTLAQGVYYDALIASGKQKFVAPMKPHNTSLLKDYPDTEDSKKVAGFIRANTLQMKMFHNFDEWPKYFWRRGYEIGPCIPEEQNDVNLSSIAAEFTLYSTECFRRYSEECNDLWELIENTYDMDLYSPLKDELLLSLACRIYRLTIQVVSFIPNWTEDMSEVFLRMVVESYIYYNWFKKHGNEETYKKFYEHGLGLQKLRKEHIDQYLKSQGLSEEEAKRLNPGLDFIKKHKMPEFIPVNIGNPLYKNLRVIAEEADCREVYVLVYAPSSSAVHGMYDSLERFYMRKCINPFHCYHKLPYHWSKSAVTSYGFINCLILTDWILADLIKTVGETIPDKMPGEKLIERINSQKDYEEFSSRQDTKDWIKATTNFKPNNSEENKNEKSI